MPQRHLLTVKVNQLWKEIMCSFHINQKKTGLVEKTFIFTIDFTITKQTQHCFISDANFLYVSPDTGSSRNCNSESCVVVEYNPINNTKTPLGYVTDTTKNTRKTTWCKYHSFSSRVKNTHP